MFLGDTIQATTDGRRFITSAKSELLTVACVGGCVRRNGGSHRPWQEGAWEELLTPAAAESSGKAPRVPLPGAYLTDAENRRMQGNEKPK